MSYLQQQLFQFQVRMKAVNAIRWPGFLPINNSKKQLAGFHHSIKVIGASATMDEYEKRKLSIFNQLNFFQLVIGICIPLMGLFHNKRFPEWAWLVASLPACISIIVLWLNAQRKYEAGVILYFICYPIATSMVYMSGIHMGLELFFILYGILAVFFLHDISHMLFSVALSMISYFMLAVVWSDRRFPLEPSSSFLNLFNQFAGIVFIFYGLFLIKKENMRYQSGILTSNKEIAQNAVLLEQQTRELIELNSVKNKLFSVIAHDLKTPMYSLRNLFSNIQEQNTPPGKIKAMLPDMINSLDYTTGLMENLLQWAKSQMQSEGLKIQALDIKKMIGETIRVLQLPAETKQLTVETNIRGVALVLADKDMIELVLRNLLSNAVKFTPEKGKIIIGVNETSAGIEIFVNDTGRGIGPEALQKINQNNYYSTNGTAQEPGTGLGLMLCKEFLLKNGSRLFIESLPGKGSTFSFLLPAGAPGSN